ncbi:MAG TPA: SagB family peptide dehydrogenase [Thermoanaerobaculia bacterium]|nr:SagB family peptide dehydrogenase [Thermoanaerobaculia bacterium]
MTIERGKIGLPLGVLGPGLRAALEMLASTGATEEGLVETVDGIEGAGPILRLHHLLSELAEKRLLCRGARCAGSPLITVVPFSRSAPEPRPGAPPGVFVLSRFACLRREGRSLIAESPLAHSTVLVHGDAGARLISRLASPCDRAALAAGVPGLAEEEAELCSDLLWEAGFLSPVDRDGKVEEEQDSQLLQWEFHDLLFHARSRAGRHDNPYGGAYPFRGSIDPLPALRPPAAAETIDLFRPDLERLMREDPPFSRVLEERRSRRSRGECPITLAELGEFLYRSSRLRRVIAGETHEVSERVYPGGGAVYELEIYPVAQCCEGLAPGLFHYDPGEHRLERLSGMTPEALALLEAAGRTASAEPPEILIVLAARFQRVTWKYRSVGYAAILKDVGALYQTMYLTATAMGLAACALGGGDSDLFARATGLGYTSEGAVGELILNRGSA